MCQHLPCKKIFHSNYSKKWKYKNSLQQVIPYLLLILDSRNIILLLSFALSVFGNSSVLFVADQCEVKAEPSSVEGILGKIRGKISVCVCVLRLVVQSHVIWWRGHSNLGLAGTIPCKLHLPEMREDQQSRKECEELKRWQGRQRHLTGLNSSPPR